MGFLPFTVTIFRDGHPDHLGDFRRLPIAIDVCRRAIRKQRVSLAVVKRGEVMVFCADDNSEWEGEEVPA